MTAMSSLWATMASSMALHISGNGTEGSPEPAKLVSVLSDMLMGWVWLSIEVSLLSLCDDRSHSLNKMVESCDTGVESSSKLGWLACPDVLGEREGVVLISLSL